MCCTVEFLGHNEFFYGVESKRVRNNIVVMSQWPAPIDGRHLGRIWRRDGRKLGSWGQCNTRDWWRYNDVPCFAFCCDYGKMPFGRFIMKRDENIWTNWEFLDKIAHSFPKIWLFLPMSSLMASLGLYRRERLNINSVILKKAVRGPTPAHPKWKEERKEYAGISLPHPWCAPTLLPARWGRCQSK